ncbi:hypothetical protein SDC9_118589 [bioreactor metagenome]|uniref:Uncharacterized protein n=1 Tax=bioreactor metagenome TaxID=1076179 RepID=A0A645C3U7_9ZZZZ
MRQKLAIYAVVAAHRCAAGDGFADQPPLHDVFRGLDAGAEEGIRRNAEAQPLLVCQGDQFPAFVELHGDHLFRKDMLPREQRAFIDWIMRRGRREVDHQLDARIRQYLLQRHRAKRVFLRALAHPRLVQIAARNQLNNRKLAVRKRLHIDIADRPAADDCRLYPFHLLLRFG